MSPPVLSLLRVRPHVIVFALVMLFAALVRIGWLSSHTADLQPDTDSYRHVAENVAQRGVFGVGHGAPPESIGPTAVRPPLYPVMLSALADASGIVPLDRIAWLHLLLGLGTVGLVWKTAGQAFDGRLGGQALASLAIAVDPLLLSFSAQTMTETLAAFCAAMILWALGRAMLSERASGVASVVAGLSLGLATLARPTFLPMIPMAVVLLPLLRSRIEKRSSIAGSSLRRFAWSGALVGIGAGIALSPWVVRNQLVFGRPILTTTHSGHTLMMGNSPEYLDYRRHHSEDLWDSTALLTRVAHSSPLLAPHDPRTNYVSGDTARELAMNEALGKMGMDFILAHPADFVWLAYDRLCQFWSPLPHRRDADESKAQRWMRFAVCVWYVGIYAGAAIGLWQARRELLRSPLIWGVVLVFVMCAVHAVYFSNIRMRAPVLPWLAVLAAAGYATALVRIWAGLKPRSDAALIDAPEQSTVGV